MTDIDRVQLPEKQRNPGGCADNHPGVRDFVKLLSLHPCISRYGDMMSAVRSKPVR